MYAWRNSFPASNTEIYSKINLQNTSISKMKFDYSYQLENFESSLKTRQKPKEGSYARMPR